MYLKDSKSQKNVKSTWGYPAEGSTNLHTYEQISHCPHSRRIPFNFFVYPFSFVRPRRCPYKWPRGVLEFQRGNRDDGRRQLGQWEYWDAGEWVDVGDEEGGEWETTPGDFLA